MERRQIDCDFDKVKSAIKSSNLCYFLEESPFSAKFYIKKKYLIDWKNPTGLSAVPRPCVSTLAQNSHKFSLPSFSYDGGLHQDLYKVIDELKSETIKKDDLIKKLCDENKNKDETIVKLKNEKTVYDDLFVAKESILEKTRTERDMFKKERDIKNEQLKQKNKVLEGMKVKSNATEEEHEKLKSNLLNKINNLNRKNAQLNEQVESKALDLKNGRKRIKNELKSLNKENEANKNIIENLRSEIGQMAKKQNPAPKEVSTTTKPSATKHKDLKSAPSSQSSPT